MTAIASRSRAESARHPWPPKPYNRSQMQPALPSPMPDASPAVFAVNGRKPHQGVAGKNPGLHQRFAARNSTTALGVSWRLSTGTASGARVSYEYDAFGNEITRTGATPNNYLYRGEQWDSDLGLYYLRARYYNPLTGRFMSRDPNNPQPRDANGMPVDPETLHSYLFAGGDPVDAIDPTGRASLEQYSIRLGQFLRAAPELKEWGSQLVECVLALGAQIHVNMAGDNKNIQEASYADVLAQCGQFLFNSFRYIYSLTP